MFHQLPKWESTWECVGSLPYTRLHSWECVCDSQIAFLAHTFPCVCFGHEPKVKVMTRCPIWLKPINHVDYGCLTWTRCISQTNHSNRLDLSENTCFGALIKMDMSNSNKKINYSTWIVWRTMFCNSVCHSQHEIFIPELSITVFGLA
jgi:hypothetical protein